MSLVIGGLVKKHISLVWFCFLLLTYTVTTILSDVRWCGGKTLKKLDVQTLMRNSATLWHFTQRSSGKVTQLRNVVLFELDVISESVPLGKGSSSTRLPRMPLGFKSLVQFAVFCKAVELWGNVVRLLKYQKYCIFFCLTDNFD